MKTIINVDRDYRCNAKKAVEKFFKLHEELADEWKETFEWMAESGTSHLIDNVMADGSVNNEWCYSLWLEEDEDHTYIAVVLRT